MSKKVKEIREDLVAIDEGGNVRFNQLKALAKSEYDYDSVLISKEDIIKLAEELKQEKEGGKQIVIELHTGEVRVNDPNLGQNLDNAGEIWECLNQGSYALAVEGKFGYEFISKSNVKDVRLV
ncbi:hypothetical protein FT641_19040 [Bacillus paranthracis]|uniref:hypothetical protein n=1 Tax=Bacillus paranthracis TaxID=2026186 RepID=UPI0018792237|nr:hypothetical protein [Bacillus paranthracis]MBE7114338.1 hypothetical protein [Bacillus paranthracis]MBE7154789.1 hypothetical protein [Bacillus paranthracis]